MSNDITDFHSLTCEPETGKRTELNVPFRKKLPKTPLVSIKDIRCVRPDATHKITRWVETDIWSPLEVHRFDMKNYEKDLYTRDDLLFLDNKTVIPAAGRGGFSSMLHKSHPGQFVWSFWQNLSGGDISSRCWRWSGGGPCRPTCIKIGNRASGLQAMY